MAGGRVEHQKRQQTAPSHWPNFYVSWFNSINHGGLEVFHLTRLNVNLRDRQPTHTPKQWEKLTAVPAKLLTQSSTLDDALFRPYEATRHEPVCRRGPVLIC